MPPNPATIGEGNFRCRLQERKGTAVRPVHILILLLVLIIVFGASKLPDIARNIGKSAKVLKSELSDLSEDDNTKQVAAGTQNPQISATPSSPAPTQGNVQTSSPEVASGQSDTADSPETK